VKVAVAMPTTIAQVDMLDAMGMTSNRKKEIPIFYQFKQTLAIGNVAVGIVRRRCRKNRNMRQEKQQTILRGMG
jgi:hypothetical protein